MEGEDLFTCPSINVSTKCEGHWVTYRTQWEQQQQIFSRQLWSIRRWDIENIENIENINERITGRKKKRKVWKKKKTPAMLNIIAPSVTGFLGHCTLKLSCASQRSAHEDINKALSSAIWPPRYAVRCLCDVAVHKSSSGATRRCPGMSRLDGMGITLVPEVPRDVIPKLTSWHGRAWGRRRVQRRETTSSIVARRSQHEQQPYSRQRHLLRLQCDSSVTNKQTR